MCSHAACARRGRSPDRTEPWGSAVSDLSGTAPAQDLRRAQAAGRTRPHCPRSHRRGPLESRRWWAPQVVYFLRRTGPTTPLFVCKALASTRRSRRRRSAPHNANRQRAGTRIAGARVRAFLSPERVLARARTVGDRAGDRSVRGWSAARSGRQAEKPEKSEQAQKRYDVRHTRTGQARCHRRRADSLRNRPAHAGTE